MNFRQLRRSLAAVVALAALAALTPAGAAATTVPAAGFAQFAGCQHPGENPLITTCLRSVTTAGVLQMGSIEVPLSKPITFSGGTTAAGEFGNSPKGGLPPVKETIPGGVVGLTGLTWLEEFLGPEALEAYAAIELAGTPGDPLVDPVTLPVKVHLINSVLGSSCYVGSNAKPIKLNLTTGTTSPPLPNLPISGLEGTTNPTGSGITDVENGIYVDNSFPVHGTNGCVLTLFGYPPMGINGLINTESGFPSAAGNNETIQEFDTEFVSAALVWP